MPKTPKLHPEKKYSTDSRLKKELDNGHLRKSDAIEVNPELNMKALWRSPVPTLSKRDRDFNIAQFVQKAWVRLQIAAKWAMKPLQLRKFPVLRPRPTIKLDDHDESIKYTYQPRNQLGVSLPQLRYEISVIHRKIRDLSLKLRAVNTKRVGLQQEMVQHQNRMIGHIGNAFQAELNLALNREQMHQLYIVCQQFVRTQPTVINIQTNNEYMRLGASIVTADKLRLVFERTDLQPLMQQHVLKQDGLQRQVHSLIGQQQKLFDEVERLHQQLLGHEALANKMGATVEWVAAAEAARAEMQSNPSMQMSM